MKRVLLTGGSGFVGSNLARRLLAEGHEVHLLLRQAHNPWRLEAIYNDVQRHIININDVESLQQVVARIRPEWVFHLAAYGAYSSQGSLPRMTEINLLATANLVDVCVRLGFEAFINTGSSSEYGYKDHAPDEEEWIEPNSSYAVTKAAATHYCRFIAQSRHVALATLRLYSVYGPYEEPTRLIPTLIMEGLQGKLPPLVRPTIARDYIYIDDICDAYLTLAARPGQLSAQVYNLGSGVQTSLQQVVEIACRELAINVEPTWGSMSDRQWDTAIWVANNEKLYRETGWRPAYSFVDGFKQMVDWFRSHPEMMAYYRSHRQVPQ